MTEKTNDITFNRAVILGREVDYMRQAVEEMHISGDGPFTRRCAALLRDELGVRAALLTTSCTAALEMAALLLDLEPGDEVLVPSFGFVSVANAVALRGAVPRFVDVREETLNLDERLIDGLAGARTRAVVPIHYSGVACRMEPLLDAAARHGLAVVEDNAHGLFATYQGRPLGSFGRFATLSFHETKNLSCGEGGALLLNRDEDRARAEWIRDKGTNRQQLFRGEVDKYTWVDLGSSYVLSDLLAAFLFGQLERRAHVDAVRSAIWDGYDRAFRGRLEAHGVRLPHVPDGCRGAHHIYWMMLPDAATRTRYIEWMRADGIVCVSHYQPLHASSMGRRVGGRPGECPVAESAAERLVRLPFYNDLEPAQRERVAERTLAFFES